MTPLAAKSAAEEELGSASGRYSIDGAGRPDIRADSGKIAVIEDRAFDARLSDGDRRRHRTEHLTISEDRNRDAKWSRWAGALLCGGIPSMLGNLDGTLAGAAQTALIIEELRRDGDVDRAPVRSRAEARSRIGGDATLPLSPEDVDFEKSCKPEYRSARHWVRVAPVQAELMGKTVVITGANTGIGRATAEALAARHPERIIIASRNREKTEPVLAVIRERGVKADFVGVELTELASVKRAADAILAMDVNIDVLINNAGIAGVRGITSDGFELAFGTNHVAHYLLTEKLLPRVRASPQGRIVIVASTGHYLSRGIDWDSARRTTASTSGFPEYATSKLANVLHCKSLARRLEGTMVTTYSIHPGTIASDIWERRLGLFAKLVTPFMSSNAHGARTSVSCAADAARAGETGLYYEEQRVRKPSTLALDVSLQDELERRSREWVGPFLV